MVILSCLLHGQPLKNTFQLEIDENESIRHLKELVEERAKELWGTHVGADDLAVHKAIIRDGGALQAFYLQLDQKRRDTSQLYVDETIIDAFPNYHDKRLHVIFKCQG